MTNLLDLEVVFPAYNEEKRLATTSTLALYHQYLTARFQDRFKIWVVVNGSSDRTFEIVQDFARRYPGVQALSIPEKGKGAAFMEVLPYLKAALFAFVDLDGAILPGELETMLVASETNDIVIGSRKCPGARVLIRPPWYRRINSIAARLFVRLVLGVSYKDPFCGFKLYRRPRLIELIPFLRSPTAMMDLNILYVASKKGLAIKEVPIEWRHVVGSKVSLLKSDWRNLKEVFRIKYFYSKNLC